MLLPFPHRTRVAILVTTLVAGALAWPVTHSAADGGAGTAPAPAPAPAPLLLVPADVITVQAGSVARGVNVTGSLEPLNRTTINARLAAVIDSVYVREGERVRQGQVLLRQNSANAAAQLRQAEAQLASANVELKLTALLEERKKALNDQKYVSDLDYAAAQGDTEVKRSLVKVQEANVAIARKAVADTAIVAPFAGVIAERYVQPGTNVLPGEGLLSLVDLSTLELAASIPARDINQVGLGSDVVFNVDSHPGRTFHGKVARINPMANGGSRTITIYVRVANADGALKGGLFASGHVVGAASTRESSTLLVPVAAVRRIDDKDQLWLIRAGKLVLQTVTLGTRDTGTGLVEVRNGVARGEQVILTDIGKRPAGMPVSVSVTR